MSVRRRTDNKKWMVEFYFTHSNGRKEIVRKTSPVNTKRGAEQYEAQLRQEMLEADGKPIEKPECMTFKKYAERFMNDCARVENKLSEFLSKESILKHHLLPAFGSKKLDQITREDIKTYRSKKLSAGFNPKTIGNQISVLTRILGEAVESGLIDYVPRVRRLKTPPPKFDYLTPDEARDLVEAAGGQWKVMILIALSTGLRQGELIGLQWRDIDFERRFILVRHSIVRGKLGTPKSNRERTVPLNDDAVDALVGMVRSGEYVFCTEKGKPLTYNMCKCPLVRACTDAGLRHISWHVLRHTFASHLVQNGISILEVQRYLGHSDVRTTQRYAHLNPEISHEAVNSLQSYRTYNAQNVIQFRKIAK